jgi:ribosomal protein L11 methyltransferase
MDYLELTINVTPKEPWTEIIIADLADKGFESFVETDEGLLAYAKSSDINAENPILGTILNEADLNFNYQMEVKIIPHQNWNAVWEADFKPVVVEEYCTILAPFHDQSVITGMPIIIQPKMSFGTGHHQTTWMMSKALFEIGYQPKTVLDMGTGTGVLAFISEKLGAEKIVAVDIEDWSVENTIENAERNACTKIEAICGDIDKVPDLGYDLILANINKNILKAHLPSYSNLLKTGGTLLLSGFFESDADELLAVANPLGLEKKGSLNKEEWCCLSLTKQ